MPVKFVLILIAVFAGGEGQIETRVFGTLEDCAEVRDRAAAIVAQHNATEPLKITHYAAECAPVKVIRAPQGKEV